MAGLRFVMITTFYPPYHFGGDANYVRQLCHTLVEMGNEVEVIHDIDAYKVLSNGINPEPIGEPEGLTVHGLQSKQPALSCFLTQQTGFPIVHGRKIRRILSKGNFDVIHYHNISLVGGPGILAYGNAIKIYTAHEHWLVCPNHVLWRHNKEVCDARKCLRCSMHFKRPPQLWRKFGLLERKMKHVDALCSPSDFSVKKHKEFGLYKKMEVLPSYIPDDLSEKKCEKNAKQTPYFLFVGRLEIIKGLQDVIPLFNNESAPAELLIVGSGVYEKELRKLAEGYNHVHFLGWLAPTEITSLYTNAIAAIMPSICYEVFPLVVLEAFRTKTPIIARELGPFPEIIAYSEAGFIFNNTSQLSEAMRKLANDQILRDSMGVAGRKAYEDRWSQEASMQTYFSIIKKIALKSKNKLILKKLET